MWAVCRIVVATLAVILVALSQPPVSRRRSVGDGIIRAAHYFGLSRYGWPINYLSTVELDRVDGELAQIAADGFNGIVLLVPWGEVQPRLTPHPSYSDTALSRLDALVASAKARGLEVILRVPVRMGDQSRSADAERPADGRALLRRPRACDVHRCDQDDRSPCREASLQRATCLRLVGGLLYDSARSSKRVAAAVPGELFEIRPGTPRRCDAGIDVPHTARSRWSRAAAETQRTRMAGLSGVHRYPHRCYHRGHGACAQRAVFLRSPRGWRSSSRGRPYNGVVPAQQDVQTSARAT